MSEPILSASVANALLIGPPKCGTSSVYDWLARHPEVAGSQPKETFYLLDEGNPLIRGATWRDAGDAGYAAYFPASAAQARVQLDATTHHIYQDTALDYARAHPGCRVICILREPAARVRSSFEFSKENLSVIRDGVHFSEYLEAVDRGEPLHPRHCLRQESAYVLERDPGYSEYVRWLRRWREAVGAGHLYVTTFERLVRDPRAVMTEICVFLGIDAAFYQDFSFESRNATVGVRSHLLHRAARRWGRGFGRGPLKRALKVVYMKLQARGKTAHSARDDAALRALRRRYAEHNRALAEEFGLDVSPWN